MPDTPLTEFVLGIRWTVAVREIYGASHILLRIEHPRLGPLDYLISSKEAMDFAAALARTAERRDETRMHGESPTSKPN